MSWSKKSKDGNRPGQTDEGDRARRGEGAAQSQRTYCGTASELQKQVGGSKSHAAGTPFRFQGSTALPICDIVLRCDKLNPVAKTFTISNKNPSFVSRGPEKVWASGIRPRSFFSLFDLFVIRACVQRLPAGVQTSLNDRSTQFKTQVSVSSISGLVHAGWKVMASRFAMQV